MIAIDRVQFPWSVVIPLSEERARTYDFNKSLGRWLEDNLPPDSYEVVEETAWLIAVQVSEETHALMIKLAFDDSTPMPYGISSK